MEQENKVQALERFNLQTLSDPLTIEEVQMLPSLALAYIGDAVFELYVRRYLLACGMTNANRLHKSAVTMVCAESQSHLAHDIEPLLTEEEADVLRRGRNAKSGHQPPNVKVTDYRLATGLESLIGYLYLLGRQDRLQVIFEHLFKEA